jgi:zinc D-Ala-D-Ala carboxypeptidase
MNTRVHIVVFAATLALVLAVLSFAPGGSGKSQNPSGPSPKAKTETTVKPTVLSRDSGNSTVANSTASNVSAPAMAAAAVRNATLKNDLGWTFGGKQQRGWYLYDLLIRQTLNTPAGSDTADFASALARWQQQMNLAPTGVLDEDTLMAMVAYWQNSRIKNRILAQPDQLLTAPSSDFWDPERLIELRQLERNTYAAYKKMVAAAIADPTLHLTATAGELAPEEKYFKIISSFRSREYQEKLRRESPNAGSAGLAVNSPHFTGKALDIYVGGEPVDTGDSNRAIQVNTPAYQWLVRNAERFGFRPYFYEPWHWEYVK